MENDEKVSMEEEFFVVVRYGGEFEERWERSLAGSASLSKCADFIAECQKEDLLFDQQKKAFEDWNDLWRDENPYPLFDHKQLKEKTRWPSGMKQKDITATMRAERDETEAYNQRLHDKHTELVKKWESARKLALEAYFNANKVPLKWREAMDRGRYRRGEEYNYRIDTIKHLK